MSIVLKNEVKDKIKIEYQAELDKNKEVAAVIKKKLAGKYNISVKTIRKILSSASDKKSKIAEPTKSKAKTYIITSWDIRTSIDPKFIDILTQLAEYYQAELYVQNLNSKINDDWFMYANKKKCNQVLTDKFAKHLFQFDGDESLSANLHFKQIDVNPTAASVISGFEGVFDKSTILCGLIKELKTEKSLVVGKQVMSTGSIGKLDAKLDDYNLLDTADFEELEKVWNRTKENTKAFQIAKELIEPSALIIDVVDDKTFFTRFVTMRKSGVVYDRNLKFSYGKIKPEIIRPECLVLGDVHAWDVDEIALAATDEMAKELKPKSAVLNDFCDFLSINHHLWGDYKHILKIPTLAEEQKKSKEVLLRLTNLFDKTYYLSSNHEAFLVKYLANEQQYKIGNNYLESIELRAWQLKTGRHPVIKYLDLDSIKNLQFVSTSHDLIIAGNSVIHGDLGIAGARVGFKGLAKVYNKMICGHFHAPQVYKNSVCVGTISKLKLGYNFGLSDWGHANCLIHRDGTTQLLSIINGKWKA